MSESTHDLLVYGIAAAKANSKAEARHYLEWLLRDETASQEEQIEAWRWLGEINDNPKDKRDCLEQVLAYNPMDPEARRALAILEGKLSPTDIVDPDRIPRRTAPATPTPIEARRYVCANCGGRMSFTPENSALTCDYCGRHQTPLSAMSDGAMFEEQNFAVALATAKGHTRSIATQSIKCSGCGASFMLSPEMISQSCPYCASPYVAEQTETRELIAPEGIVPFDVSREQAQRAVLEWYRVEGYKILSADALPAGVYLPAWTFDVGGVIEWNCQIEVNDAWLTQSGTHLVGENDLLVAASHTLSTTLTCEIDAFPLAHLVPYDARYLAAWPAETYQITVSDASLVARSRAIAKSQPIIEASIPSQSTNVCLNTMKLVIESFKLVLLPLWIARYHYEDKWYNVVINGQTGKVRGEKPQIGALKWLKSILEEDNNK